MHLRGGRGLAAAGAAGGCLAGVLAGAGPGMAGGPYAGRAGRAACGPPLLVRPGLPALHGEGPAPGRWVKNRTTRHLAPGLCGGHRIGRPASCGGPAVIPMFPRSNTRRQMHRVPVSTRNVMIVPRLTAVRPCRAAAVRRLSSLPQAAVMNRELLLRLAGLRHGLNAAAPGGGVFPAAARLASRACRPAGHGAVRSARRACRAARRAGAG